MKRKRRRDTGEEEYSIDLEAGPLDLHSGRDIYTESQRSGRELPAALSCILELGIQRGAGPKHLKLRPGWGRSGHSFLLGFSLSVCDFSATSPFPSGSDSCYPVGQQMGSARRLPEEVSM